jgi:tetratricopeptide (TPR) repeat protein
MKKNILFITLLIIPTIIYCQATSKSDHLVNYKLEIIDTSNTDYIKAIELINKGLEKSDMGDYLGAIKDFDSAIFYQPEMPAAYSNRGAAYYGNATGTENPFHYNQAYLDFCKSIELDSSNIDYYYNRGLACKDMNWTTEAISDFEYVVKMNPDFAFAYTYLGICYGQSNMMKKSLNAFNTAIKIDSTIAEFYYNRSVLYSNQGNNYLKTKDLKKVISINPLHSSANHNLGYAYKDGHQFEKAILHFTAALQGDPMNHKSRYQRAVCYEATGQYNEALEDLNYLIEIEPNEASLYVVRIRVYMGIGDKKKVKSDREILKKLQK